MEEETFDKTCREVKYYRTQPLVKKYVIKIYILWTFIIKGKM